MSSNEIFLNSYQRCRIGVHFLTDFLDHFCATNHRFQERFGAVDTKKQARMLKASLVLIQNASALASVRDTVRKLGDKHKEMGLNISEEELDMWVESLLATVEKYDPLYNDVIEKAWRDTLEVGIGIMKEKACQ